MRTGVVIGMPRWIVVSSRVSVVLRWIRIPRSVLAAGVARDRHVDCAGADGTKLPGRCGARMAEHGVAPAGQDGGHPAPLDSQHAVTHGKHALMEAVKILPSQAAVDVLVRQSQEQELRPRDDPVLCARERRDRWVLGASRRITTKRRQAAELAPRLTRDGCLA